MIHSLKISPLSRNVNNICPIVLALVALLASATGDHALAGDMPPHLVLQRPSPTPYSTPYSAPVAVQATAYPYGYFGACARPQWQRQFGINRSYTQWGQK